MTITVTPTITPTFNQLGPFCQGSTAPSFPNTSSEGITGVWGPPGINTGAIGTNTYVFVSNPGQCANNVSMAITVNPFLAPVFPVQEPICAGDNLVLPIISNNGITGTWTPAINNTNTTTYTFTPSAGQCSSTTSMTVQVFATPIIEAGNNVTICEGSSIELSANGGNQYSWSNGIQNGQSFIPIQTQVYYVTGTDINGCEDSDSIIVTLVPIPNAQFSSNVNSGTAPLLVTFSNTSSNATSFVWSYGDGNENSTIDLSNVSNTFLNPGSYTVWLIASNGLCADSISSLIQVNSPADPIFEIPNVLTPNGDGTNDEWFIFTQNVSELEVVILNRWGNEVSKLNGISESWNGRTPNGDEVTDGTYFYSYQAKAFNGKEFSGHGFLTLLR
jgi:gliding motility-associated-like protein